jgi:2-keto-4-pentenoate hydratase
MSERNDLADAFIAARRNPGRPVAAALLRDLTAEDAMAVQGAVLRKLGETVPVAKVSVVGGRGRAAPIFASEVIPTGGTLHLNGGSLVGLELEIAAVLKTDITPEIAARGREAVRAAIDHYIVGIELIGTRIDDRDAAGPFGGMADNMISAGYVLGTQRLAVLPDVDGLSMTGVIDGEVRDFGRAAHPFGDAIAPILSYATAPYDAFGGVRAGLVITTGSLSPLIEVPPGAAVSLQLGAFAPVRFQLA